MEVWRSKIVTYFVEKYAFLYRLDPGHFPGPGSRNLTWILSHSDPTRDLDPQHCFIAHELLLYVGF